MSNLDRGPNPLRPYHIPAPAMPPSDDGSSRSGAGSPSKHGASLPRTSLRSSAQSFLSDLDYGDYVSDAAPPVAHMLKTLIDQGMWKYTSVFLAQPFELAKTILQVQDAGAISESQGAEQEKAPRSARSGERDYTVSET